MKLINTYMYEVKKSKFVAYYYSVDTKEEVEEVLSKLKKENKKAKHIPYAYKIDNLVRKSDDKEPANTAGTPLYNLIEQKNLNHLCIAVVRYFGGIKLGAGGLLRAYLTAANRCIGKEED